MIFYVKINGFKPSRWRRNANMMKGLTPVVVNAGSARPACDFCGVPHRRGKLALKDKGVTVRNGKALLEWVWIWLK
jgi:hypothetical protein